MKPKVDPNLAYIGKQYNRQQKREFKQKAKELRHRRLADYSANKTKRLGIKEKSGLGKTIAKEVGKTVRAASRNVTEASIARSENMNKALAATTGTKSGLEAALNQEVITSQGTNSTGTGLASNNTSMNYDSRLGDNV